MVYNNNNDDDLHCFTSKWAQSTVWGGCRLKPAANRWQPLNVQLPTPPTTPLPHRSHQPLPSSPLTPTPSLLTTHINPFPPHHSHQPLSFFFLSPTVFISTRLLNSFKVQVYRLLPRVRHGCCLECHASGCVLTPSPIFLYIYYKNQYTEYVHMPAPPPPPPPADKYMVSACFVPMLVFMTSLERQWQCWIMKKDAYKYIQQITNVYTIHRNTEMASLQSKTFGVNKVLSAMTETSRILVTLRKP